MARRGIVSPRDHDQLVEVETFCKFLQMCGNLLCRSDDRLAAELLGGRHLEGRIRTFCFFGRHQRKTDTLSAIDNGAFAGFELVQSSSSVSTARAQTQIVTIGLGFISLGR